MIKQIEDSEAREQVINPSSSSSLELSDTKVFEPEIRALFGTTSQLCEVVVLKSRTVSRTVLIKQIEDSGAREQVMNPQTYRGTLLIRNSASPRTLQ